MQKEQDDEPVHYWYGACKGVTALSFAIPERESHEGKVRERAIAFVSSDVHAYYMILRFRDMYALTHHRTAPPNEYAYNWMHLSPKSEVPDPSQYASTAALHQATPDTPSHAGYDAQRGRYRGSLKVFTFARTVFW